MSAEPLLDVASNASLSEGGGGKEVGGEHRLKVAIILAVGVALFADFLLLSVVIPILPSLLSTHYDATAIALCFASKPLAQLLTGFGSGPLVDRVGSRVMLVLSTLILATSTGVFALGVYKCKSSPRTGFPILVVARSVQGIASSIIMSAGVALVSISHHPSIHGAAMGSVMSGVAAGVVIGPPLGGIMNDLVGPASPFLFVIALLLVDVAVQLCVFGCTDTGQEGGMEERAGAPSINTDPQTTSEANMESNPCTSVRLLGDSHIACVAGGVFFSSAAVAMMEVLIPLHLEHKYKLKPIYQGLMFAITTLGYLLCTPLVGLLCDKVPKWRVFTAGPIILGLGMASFCLSSLTAQGKSLPLIAVSLAVTGAGVAFSETPSLPLLAAIGSWRNYPSGSLFALQDMVASSGFALGPLVASQVESVLGGVDVGFLRTSLCLGGLVLLFTPFCVHLRTVQESQEGPAD